MFSHEAYICETSDAITAVLPIVKLKALTMLQASVASPSSRPVEGFDRMCISSSALPSETAS